MYFLQDCPKVSGCKETPIRHGPKAGFNFTLEGTLLPAPGFEPTLHSELCSQSMHSLGRWKVLEFQFGKSIFCTREVHLAALFSILLYEGPVQATSYIDRIERSQNHSCAKAETTRKKYSGTL